VASGELEFLGRADEQVKLRGLRIEPGEIEAALRAHRSVRDAVAVVREDVPGDRRLVAYVTPRTGGEVPRADELRAHLRERLPEYMVPGVVAVLDELPLTATGKVDRRALPAPDRAMREPGVQVTPRSALEESLVQVWETVLGVRPVGVTDDFFELGGHSLLAVRAVGQMERLIGKRIPLGAFMADPTIASVVAALEEGGEAEPPLVTIQPAGTRPPLFFVHPAGGQVTWYTPLASRLGDDQPFYGLRARGMSEDEAPVEDVRAMAADYVRAIRAVQPNGPYHLGGWSFGGLVAYEMACRLQREGERVGYLAIVDSVLAPSSRWSRLLPGSRTREALFLLRSFCLEMGVRPRDLGLTPAAVGGRDVEAWVGSILDAAKEAGTMHPNQDLAGFRRLFQVYRASQAAMRNYRPGPFAGDVALVYSGRSSPAVRQRMEAEWRRQVRGSVGVRVLDGDHHAIVREPLVAELAEYLSLGMARTRGG
jgi:thioesterase domain-containing protein